MANFENGVMRYITGECVVSTHFPVDWQGKAVVNCTQCRFFSRSGGCCKLTGEISEFPAKYIGSTCPLSFTDDGEERKEENA